MAGKTPKTGKTRPIKGSGPRSAGRAKKAAPKKTRKGPGRPAFEPDQPMRAMVATAAGYGLTHPMIADLVTDPRTGKRISVDTLRKYFEDELSQGVSESATRVAQTAYRLATSGECPAMTMFWLKTRLQWRETSRHELVGPDGGPIRTIDSKMTPDEAAEAYAATLHDPES